MDRIIRRFQRDLFAVAHVAHLDNAGAWALTELVEPDWGCYGGAVRLYWPFTSATPDPRDHRFWRRHVSLWGRDAEDALDVARSEIKTAIFAQTAMFAEPPLIEELIQARRTRAYSELLGDDTATIEALRADNDRLQGELEVAESLYDEQTTREQQEITKLSAERERLQQEVEELTNKLLQKDAHIHTLTTALKGSTPDAEAGAGGSPVKTVEEPEPRNVEEAVAFASERFKHLVLGEDVSDGVKKLDPSAGPPGKVYNALKVLDRYTRVKPVGLGKGDEHWLQDEGLDVSREAPSLLRNPRQRVLRSFNAGPRGSGVRVASQAVI